MNKNRTESVELARAVEELANQENGNVEVVICPTYPVLASVDDVLKGGKVALGAQDMHWEDQGAYTGKISADMLLDVGVKFVILGHSEQRTYFHETNETVNKKTKKALAAGLLPIVCVGETLEEREAGKTNDVIADHVRGAFAGIPKEDAAKCVIAYEPVWAIGTGKTATSDQAQEAHAFIRGLLIELYDADLAQSVRIQYGGSMKPENAGELLSKPDVDGGLIGGASLKADSFLGIVKAAPAS